MQEMNGRYHMSTEKATRDSWKRIPMPEKKVRLEVDQTFSQEEYERLQLGRIPQQMEDKWFIYFEDNWLFFHRSWTGYCVYQVRLEPWKEGCKIVEVWANDDPNQFRSETPEKSKGLLLALLGYPALYLAIARRKTMSLPVQHVDVYLEDRGRGEPVLFLHGVPDSSQMWDGVIQHLEGQYRCIAPDLPGLGRSVAPSNFSCSLEHM